jgi:large repetitive protein
MSNMRRRFTLVSLLLTLSVILSNAQDGGFTTVSIKVREAYNDWSHRNTPTWNVNRTCVSSRNGNGWMYFDQPVGIRGGNIQNDISVSVDSWQEDSDCNDRCAYESSCRSCSLCGSNDSDDGLAQWNVNLNLSGNNNDNNTSGYPVVPPGQFYDLPQDFMQSGYGLRLSVSYSTPQPKSPEINIAGIRYTGKNLCNTQEITLSSKIHVNPVYNFLINYQWEYHVKGDTTLVPYERCIRTICGIPPAPPPPGEGGNPQSAATMARPIDDGPCFCEESVTDYYKVINWRASSSSSAAVSNGELVVPLNSLQGLGSLTSATQVFFRVKATANGSTSLLSLPSIAVNVNPSAPLADLASTISCSALATGKIILQNTTTSFTTPMPKFLIKSGVVADPGCDPNVPGSCSGGGNISGDVRNLSSYEIPTPVVPGTYTVFLFNGGEAQGFCPSAGKQITVASIPNLSVNALQAYPITCNGVSSGSISYSLSQGNANVGHTLRNVNTGQEWNQFTAEPGASISFGSLPPGSYQLTSNDNCSPVVTQSNITISQPAKVTSTNLQAVDATCASPGNGTVRVDVTKSGDPPTSSQFHYQLYKDGGFYNEAFSTDANYTWLNLPIGNYSVTAREPGAQDCNASANNFSIASPPALSISSIVPSSTLCQGSADGMLSIAGAGGAGSYYYEITPSSGGPTVQNATGSFTGLAGGNYQVVLRNQLSGCSDSYAYPIPVFINSPSGISILLNQQNISCNGLSNGSILATPSGGTPMAGLYSYDWEMQSGSSPTWATLPNAGSSISNLSAGNYRVRVRDGNGCQQPSADVQIMEPSSVQISDVVVNDIKCLGESGALVVTAIGGTGSLSYQYSSDGGGSYQALSSATLLSAGNYQVRATDQNGCPATSLSTYSITAPPSALTFTESVSDYNGFSISCFGGNNGSIDVAASGGNGAAYSGYTFAIDNGTFAPNPRIGNLYAGTYLVKVMDGRGCVVEKSVPLTQSSDQINASVVEKKDVVCGDDKTGVLEISATGGLPPYQYALGTNPAQASGRFEGLESGNYTIKVIDNNQCSTDYLNSISSGSPRIQFDSVEVLDVKCFDEMGHLKVTASGGSAPLTFEYAANGTTVYSTFTNTSPLSAGDYTVRIKDSKGCTIQPPTTYSITQPSTALSISSVLSNYNTYGVSCYGGSNGTASIRASGGNGGSYTGYKYAVNTNPYSDNPVVTGMVAGTYTLKIKDARGCEVEELISITQPAEAVSTTLIDKKNVVCAGDKEGSIEVQALGGVSPYQFALNNTVTQSNGRFTGLRAADYRIVVRDANQCESTIQTSITSSNVAPQVTPTVAHVKCFGESSGSIDVSLAGGSPPFNYNWVQSSKTSPYISDLLAGIYTVKITDNVGCSDYFEIGVTQPDKIAMNADIVPTCFGQRTGKVTINAGGGTAPYTYSALGSNDYQDTPAFTSLKAGDYTLRIKDANGCVHKKDVTVAEKNGENEPNFLVSTKRYASDTLVATDISVPKPDSVHWIFDPRIAVVQNDEWSPQMVFKEAGKFVMSMTGFYSGCDYSVTKTVTINPYDPEAVLIDEPKYKNIEKFEMYPNPSTSSNVGIDIKLAGKQYITVSIIDVLGTVRQAFYWNKVKEVKETITLSNNIVTGVYLVRVVTESDVRELRLMVNQ